MKKLLIILIGAMLLISSCTLIGTAKNTIGTWHTITPVKVYIETDYQDFVNMELVATEYWDIEMTVTSTDLVANTVNVDWTFTRSDYEALVDDPGVTPEVSPMYLTGTISGDTLYLEAYDDSTFAVLSFSNGSMEGFIDYNWNYGWAQRDYTIPGELRFEKE